MKTKPTLAMAKVRDCGSPKALVLIYTFEPERFPELFKNVVLFQEGEWWEV